MKVDVVVEGLTFGARYKDLLTEFVGTAESVWLKHDGSVQVSLAYHDGTIPKSVWLDASRLELIHDRPRPGIQT